jgi:hypothetical protein
MPRTINTDLMRRVAEVIRNNPERHSQTVWIEAHIVPFAPTFFQAARAEEIAPYALRPLPEKPEDPDRPVCMTTACVAGWAAVLGAPPGTVFRNLSVTPPGGTRPTFIWNYARNLLGLTESQADWLFAPYRSREQILAALDYLPDHPEVNLQRWWENNAEDVA